MPLVASTRLGPYEIIAPLGAGGMGEVYRARDTRLDRLVALKTLPDHLSAKGEYRQRFDREARAISTLSHPNICSLFDVGSVEGTDFLVMEYLEGESLAEKLRRGPLSVDQVLRYGTEIASALDAAHRCGVIHRDLKPGNIVVTRSGTKLLDFGLAKLHRVLEESPEAPTDQAITRDGAVFGTLPYMAPEQLEGQEADARTDIFALGAVLYEMATGRRAFQANSQASLISAILNEQPPPLRSIQPISPDSLERIVRKCLEKDPDNRWQSARDLADELRWISEGSTAQIQQTAAPHLTRRYFAAALVVVFAVLAAIFALPPLVKRFSRPVQSRSIAFGIDAPPNAGFAQRAVVSELAISPDGSTIAFVALTEARRRIWIRKLDSIDAHPLETTEGATSPFWSPDGKQLGFFADGYLKRVPVDGGPAQPILKARGGGGSWNRDGKILFCEWGPDTSEQIELTDLSGSAAAIVTHNDGWNYWPSFLPDGKHFVFLYNQGREHSSIRIGAIDTPETHVVANVLARPIVASDGTLYYVQSGSLMRQKLDLEGLRARGEPAPVVENVFEFLATGASNISVSADGDVVAYQRRPLPTQFAWVDRNGRTLSQVSEPNCYIDVKLSPDGHRVATSMVSNLDGDIDVAVIDLQRGILTRITSQMGRTSSPVWTRDGRALVLTVSDETHPTRAPQLMLYPLDGTPGLPLSAADGPQFPTSITTDGRSVIYSVSRGRDSDIEMRPIAAASRPLPVVASPFNETDGVLSPDGKWLAFTSDESGRPEVYVQPFGRRGEKVRISVAGGIEPEWRRDQKELYYIAPDKNLMAVPIAIETNLTAGPPEILFQLNSAGMMEFGELGSARYDPAPDGQKFLVRRIVEGADRSPVVVLIRPKAK